MPLSLANLAYFCTSQAVSAVLLPTQVALIDPDPVQKALNLGVVESVAAACGIVAQPLFGALSDRSGKRNVWIIGLVIPIAAALMLLSEGVSIAWLLVFWCVITILKNGYMSVFTVLVPDRVPRSQRGLASVFVGVGTPLAAVLGVGTASALIGRIPIAYATFATALVVSAVALVVLNPERGREPFVPRPAARTRVPWWRSILGLVSALGDADFRAVFISRAAVMTAYTTVSGYLLYLLQARVTLPDGLAPTTAMTALVAVMATAMVIGTIVGGVLADRLGRYREFVVVACAVMAGASLPPIFSPSLAVMFFYCGLLGLGFGCFLAVDNALGTLVLPRSENAARDLGLFNVAGALPKFIAPLIAGFLVAAFGGGPDAYATLFIVSIAFAVLGGTLVLRVRGVR